MRKLIVVNIISLDGYYEGPGRNVMVMPMDGAFDTYNLERMQGADTVLLGGHSYRMFSSFWPTMANHPDASPTNREFSRLYHLVEKVAISNELILEESAPWRDTTTIIDGNHVYDEIAALKRKPGKDIVMYGSRVLWNDLLAHGLIDELHFMIGNVVLGGGTPTFIEPIAYNDPKLTLRHIDTRKFEGSENILMQYKVEYKSEGNQ